MDKWGDPLTLEFQRLGPPLFFCDESASSPFHSHIRVNNGVLRPKIADDLSLVHIFRFANFIEVQVLVKRAHQELYWQLVWLLVK